VIADAARDQVPVLPDQLWTTRYEKLRERAMVKSSSMVSTIPVNSMIVYCSV
jgi:hypothetical protein